MRFRIFLAFAIGVVAWPAQAFDLYDPLTGWPYTIPMQRPGTRLDHSDYIHVGNAPQSMMPSNTNRQGCFLQNQTPFEAWISEIGDAGALRPSIWFPSGMIITCASLGNPLSGFSIFSATAGSTNGPGYIAREW